MPDVKKPNLPPVAQAVVQKSVVSDNVQQPMAQHAADANNVIDGGAQAQEPLIVGIEEMRELQIAQEVKEAIDSVWAAPAGIKPHKQCVAHIKIGTAGVIDEVCIEQSSEVLAYDIHVRNSIYNLVVPKQLWGKTIKIIFDGGNA